MPVESAATVEAAPQEFAAPAWETLQALGALTVTAERAGIAVE